MKYYVKLLILLAFSSAFISCSPQGGAHRNYLISQETSTEKPSGTALHES